MRSRAFVVIGVLSTALVTGGWFFERGLSGGSSISGPRLFDEVMTHIERYYVDSVSTSDLYGKAIDGMLNGLHDPHTVFLRADRLARLNESTTGNYGGVGIEIDVRDGWVIVVSPLAGSPAERAGIETGDRIAEVEGKSAKGWTMEETRKALRGVPGTTVQVVMDRAGARRPVSLVRQEIHRSAVGRSLLLSDGVGFVDLNVFSDSTEKELSRAIDSLSKAGMRSLVLDLRANPGGLLTQGVGVSDLFLDRGQEIVKMRGRVREANHEFVDSNAQRWPNLPIVVLVDEYSASASEIVAGALQDHDRAVVIGHTSYGKGSAQTVYPISGGSALKLTTAKWFTPAGRSISKPARAEEDEEVDADAAPTATPMAERERFKTDGGRTVFGGGGITPDIMAGDTAVVPSELALQNALGRKVPQFRDAITDYATSLKGSNTVTSPDFVVTDAMRDAVWQRMRQRGIEIDRAVYDAAAPLVSRFIAPEVTRYVFGRPAEVRRNVQDDPIVQRAIDLTRGVKTQQELLARVSGQQGRRSE
jgi:carboxyl-terminal processing protease